MTTKLEISSSFERATRAFVEFEKALRKLEVVLKEELECPKEEKELEWLKEQNKGDSAN
jgi:hypothetical protein